MPSENEHHLGLLLWLGMNEGSVRIETGTGSRLLVVRALVDGQWKVVARKFRDGATLDAAVKRIHAEILAFESKKKAAKA